MINVGELITDPDFCQTFTLIRRVGEWNEGVWNPSEARITMTGITHPASGRELEMLPEADRTKNLRTFYGRSGMTPRLETQNRMADEIAYNGSVFKIIQEQDYDDYGYWQAVGIEEEGRH